ncbi:MAG: TolC family protein [Acidobacteriota bacterium]
MTGVAACLWLLALRPVAADPPLTREQCIDVVLRTSPLVRAAIEQQHAAEARVSSTMALPLPVVSFDSDLQPRPFDFANSGESYFGISQAFELPNRRRARKAVAAREVDQALTDTDLVRLELRFEVTQAFDALLLAKEQLAYAEQDLALSRDFVAKTETKFGAGDIAEVELIRARVEAAQAERTVRLAASQVARARSALNVLMVRPSGAPLEVTGSLTQPRLDLDLSRLREAALTSRPEARRARLDVDRRRLERRVAGLINVPDLEVGFASHRIEGDRTWWDVTLSATVPVFWWQARKGPVAEADALVRAAALELEHVQTRIRAEVDQAHLGVVTSRAQTELYERDILGPATRVYDMLLFSYQQGELSGIELIDARRTLAAARQGYAEAQFEHQLALALLERSVGQALREPE